MKMFFMTLIWTLISSLCLNALAKDGYAAHVRGKIDMINDIYIYIYIIGMTIMY